MKSGYFKKTVVFIAIMSLFVTLLSGCGDGNKNLDADSAVQDDNMANENQNELPANDGDSAEVEDGDKAPLGKYDPPIDISFVRGIDDDLAANILPQIPDETIDDNRWHTLYEEEMGINITYDWTVKGNETSDAFVQKLNVVLASGDLPDVVLVNPSQLKQLADSDMIEDMTQYFDDYASELTKDVYTQEGPGLLDSVTFEGRMMAIPDMVSMVETTPYLWIRADWLEKLNLDPPSTMDDVLEICEAFTTQDPDGNGEDDTYGIAITKDLYGGAMGLEGFYAGYHAYPGMWLEDNSGELVYGSIQPEVKTALEKLAEMYKAGQIDKEFAVKDGEKVAETIAAGKVGLQYGAQWNPMYPLISNYNNDNDADWTGYPLVSSDDNKAMVPLQFGSSRIFAVKKGYEHPEALVKMINMHLEKNWGETNDFNKYYMPVEDDGLGVWKFSPVTPFPPYKNLDAFEAIDEARDNNDFSVLEGEAKVIQENIEAYENGDKSLWGWERIYGPMGVFRNLVEYRDNDQLLHEKFVGAPTETMVEKMSTLEKMEQEFFVKIIMGEASIEEFDEFVANWNNVGGEKITQEVNEWYSSLD